MRWLDLQAHDVALRPKRLPSGAIIIVLEGRVREEDARRLHFQQTPKGVWYSTRYTQKSGDLRPFRLSEFVPVYAQAHVRDMPLEEVLGIGAYAARETQSASQIIATEYEVLGENHEGAEVGEDPTGRFLRQGDRVVREPDPAQFDPRFLRGGQDYADRAVDLTLHVYGYVRHLASGTRGDPSDIDHLCHVLFGSTEGQDPAVVARAKRDVEAAIEVAAARFMRQAGAGASPGQGATLEACAALDTRLPRLPRELAGEQWQERGFTPLLAQAAAQMVRSAGRRVVLPYAANGMLSGFLPEASDINILLPAHMRADQERFGELLGDGVRVNPFDPEHDSWAPESADVLIMAPQQSGQTGELDEYQFTQPQHYEAARALVSIPHHGEAVLLFTGDEGDLEQPVEATAVHGFLQWAATHYKLDSVLALDSSLIGRPGDRRAAWLAKIGGRRWTPAENPLPSVEYIYSRDELVARLEEQAAAATAAPSSDEVNPASLSDVLAAFNRQFDEADQVVLNEFQRPYVSLTAYDTPTLAVPKHLVRPTREALNRFARRHGPVEPYLEQHLGWDVQACQERGLAVEQADAIALAHTAMSQGEEFILGDMTGTGKGRILAALIKAAVNRGEIVTFVTKTSDLFSDLWRDLCDIGVEGEIKPFLTETSAIYDPAGQQVATFDRREVEAFVERGLLPSGANLVLCTYLGLSKGVAFYRRGAPAHKREGFAARRAHTVIEHLTGRPVLLDESHLGTGDGAFHKVVMAVKERASAVVDASATYLRDPRGLLSYPRVFPEHVQQGTFINTVKRGGTPLQEVVSQMLVADGKLVRREHDLSRLKIELVEDQNRGARNEGFTDELAEALTQMRELADDIRYFIGEAMRDPGHRQELSHLYKGIKGIEKARIDGMGFADFYHLLAKQVTVAMKQELTVERALEALRNDEKPIVVVEHNGAALHKDLLPEGTGEAKEGDINGDASVANYPDIKDVLRRRVKRMLEPKVGDQRVYDEAGNRITEVRVNVYDVLERIGATSLANRLRGQIRRAHEAIDRVRDLPFAPLDYVRDRLEAAGYSVAEASGRTHRVVCTPDGAVLERQPKTDRVQLLREFNDGRWDAVVGTAAITTGNSMHSDRRFADHRRRALIEVQLMSVVHDRIQLLGRVDRRSQVVAPRICSLSTGLPMEARLIAMSNGHLSQMSASVTSNRNAPQAIPSYDLFNRFGDKAVMRVMAHHPEKLGAMMMTPDQVHDMVEQREAGALARKVTGAMMLLPVADQRTLLEEFDSEYNLVLMLEEGELGRATEVGELDLRARTERRIIYQGETKTHYESEFDRPVELAEISYKIPAAKIPSAKQVIAEVEHQRTWGEKSGEIGPDGWAFPRICAKLDDYAEGFRARCENEKASVAQNGRLANRSMAAHVLRQFEMLERVLPRLVPGALIPRAGDTWNVVLSVAAPSEDAAEGVLTNPRNYQVRYLDLFRGRERTEPVSWMLNEDMDPDTIEHLDEDHPAYADIDWVRGHTRKIRRVVLQGNLFEAARLASQHGLGRTVVYTDENGGRHRAVLCPEKTTWEDVLRLSPPFTQPDQGLAYLLNGYTTQLQSHSRIYEPKVSVRLKLLDGDVLLSAPKDVLDTNTSLGHALLGAQPDAHIETQSKARNKVRIRATTAAAILGQLRPHLGDGLFVMEKKPDGIHQRQWQQDYASGRELSLQQLLERSSVSAEAAQEAIEAVLAGPQP